MSTVPERLAALRAVMKQEGVDVCLVPTDDFHGSEYVGDYFKCRRFITGFTGSAGTAVILAEEAGLWTDGRYFLQAAQQLEGSGITLYKMGEEGVPTVLQFLAEKMKAGMRLAFDGRTVSAAYGKKLQGMMAEKGADIVWDKDLVGQVWTDRPALSCRPASSLSPEWTGEDRVSKLARVREKMAKLGGTRLLLSTLDDIAWLLNIRGDDVACNPVVLSYLSLSADEALLFIQEEAVSSELRAELEADGVTLRPYGDFYRDAASLPATETILYDGGRANYTLVRSLPEGAAVKSVHTPTALMKAVKNETEMAHIREAHVIDGVAVTRFIYWLKNAVGKEPITEISASAKLEEFRRMSSRYLGPSFDTISGYGPHGAIVHYFPTPETDIPLEAKGFLLVDSGGQYLEGTTDITRTIVLGETTQKEKEYFTRVLRGNLNLADARFLAGCDGQALDVLAREPLWEVCADYNHGTGHGVGYFLNVHEGPNGFRFRRPAPGTMPWTFEEGMLTSDEPGIYLENEFGIRHENLMLCRKDEKNSFGQFMRFETVTMVPFDLEAVLPDQMSAAERERLNRYHAKVYETISPYLEGEEKEWLKQATRAI